MSVSFFSLPPHDVVYPLILPRLSTVEVCNLMLVCRRFQEMCEDYFHTFCRTLHYSEQGDPRGQVDRNRSYILCALKKCRKMKRFYLNLEAQKSNLLNPQLAQSCNSLLLALSYTHSQLTSLTLQNLACTDALVSCFERLGKQCWKLQELHLEAIPYFNDDCFRALTNDCCYIVVLTLKTLPKFKGVNLERLAERCCMLKDLNISGTCNIETACLERMLRKSQALKALDLSSTFATVTDRTVLLIKEYCTQLKFLHVAQCSRITGRYLTPLIQRGVNVEGMAFTPTNEFRTRVLSQI